MFIFLKEQSANHKYTQNRKISQIPKCQIFISESYLTFIEIKYKMSYAGVLSISYGTAIVCSNFESVIIES